MSGWQISIDTGGTFTDCIGIDSKGKTHFSKVLSSSSIRSDASLGKNSKQLKLEGNMTFPKDFFVGCKLKKLGDSQEPILIEANEGHWLTLATNFPGKAHEKLRIEIQSPDEAPVLGIRLLTQTPHNQPLPPLSLRLGTTKATNALLEGKGEPIAFFTTAGFHSALRVGNQKRPHLFSKAIQKTEPIPLPEHTIEVPERIDAHGKIIQALELEPLNSSIERLLSSGIKVAAICLLHSYANPTHEEALKEQLLSRGFQFVSCSSEIAPFIKYIPRAQTTTVNAHLSPVMQGYLSRIRSAIGFEASFQVMNSAGVLVKDSVYKPFESLLSGPAGGIVGASRHGERFKKSQIIAFDMGGTSTDVSRYDGSLNYQSEHQVGNTQVMAPALKIETVAAGGGSICGIKNHMPEVGPESSGAFPGPACYGARGPLTLSDVNLLLGRLYPPAFQIPLDEAAARDALLEVKADYSETVVDEELLSGFLRIANERMANAIKKVSLSEGHSIDNYHMVAFGGAGGMHACAVSEILNIPSILIPRESGILSAYGIQEASTGAIVEAQCLQDLDEIADSLESQIETICRQTREKAIEQGAEPEYLKIKSILLEMRIKGQESSIQVDYQKTASDLCQGFIDAYQKRFGYSPEKPRIEVVRIQVNIQSQSPLKMAEPFKASREACSHDQRALFSAGQWQEVPVYLKEELQAGMYAEGPCLIVDNFSSIVVEAHWRFEVREDFALELIHQPRAKREIPTDRIQDTGSQLQLFSNRLHAIVDEMGVQLERTALSTNIRERLDFSCAILDAQGYLVVNAPHIPVHLGALGVCVREIMAHMSVKPGDVILTNDPAFGGSHLPDLTLITPIFHENALLGFVANRAHHAEIGGKTPGSMPPDAQSLAEEGVIIRPFKLIGAGKPQWDRLRNTLSTALYPSRNIPENIADINAQIASNQRGVQLLSHWIESMGSKTFQKQVQDIRQHAYQRIQETLRQYEDGLYEGEKRLDDGHLIKLAIQLRNDRMQIDFTGSDPIHPGNLNATKAIINSAVIYFLRLLIGEDIPLNEGLLQAIEIQLPTGFLNPKFSENPTRSPAVVGGNVETSQQVVECLIQTMGIMAASQGTMNNLIFGNDHFGFYETIGGGSGAGDGFAGSDAVHVHMTNTALTDVEILEHRYPVRVREFGIRPNSGGMGRFPGGHGIIRELEFLNPLTLCLMAQQRRQAPRGMKGGSAGKAGQDTFIHEGKCQRLQLPFKTETRPGDRLRIETPGGGAWGQ